MSKASKIRRAVIHVLCIVYMIVTIFPLAWMFISGFKQDSDLFSSPWSIPSEWQISNYIYVWLNYIKDSVLMLILSGMMLAPQCSLIPIYKMLSITGFYDTRLGLLIPYVAYRIPFSFFLMWSFMINLPVEVEEAAFIDGSSIINTFFNIVMKMSKPVIATTAVMSARYIWNDFAFALVFTEGRKLQTVPLAIFAIRSTSNTQWSILIAGLALAALPMIIVYICLQKYFVNGLNSGAVKG